MLFAKGYIPDLDTDKDVVQEVFLSLIESQETFNDVDNLKAYLYGTVRHKCLKYLRHEEVKRRYQKYMQSEAPDETKTYEERVIEKRFTLSCKSHSELTGTMPKSVACLF